jgi:hypothetical protein
MASNPTRYNLYNEPLSVKNVIKYLYSLNYYDIIPHFTLDITDTELHITTIYSASSTSLPVNGYTNIIYNIHTKKWKGIINLASIIDGHLVDKTFTNIQRDFPFVIENNLLKIKYQNPYVEYVIESDYIEDVLEPSLNVFVSRIINPYNINTLPSIMDNMRHYLKIRHFASYEDVEKFYDKIDAHEKHLLFLLKKNIINDTSFLPEELWENIYKFH